MFRATRFSSRMCIALVCATAVVGGTVVFADHHEGKMMMKEKMKAAMNDVKMMDEQKMSAMKQDMMKMMMVEMSAKEMMADQE